MTVPSDGPRVLVLAPDDLARQLPDFGDGVLVAHYRTTGDLCQALATAAQAFVVITDALPHGELPRVAETITSSGAPCIEVRSEAWDGTTFSPVSAACRGVISGFGLGGVAQAVDVLRG
jgi:hypothetical protein